MTISTPTWVKHAIFYQIFPDRFARSERTIHPPGLKFKTWGSDPREQGFQGGDLYGVIEKLDYLQELGVNALYFNPVFSSAANHRYHTFDYYQVDPLLGGNTALRELLDAAHSRDIYVVLDGVFNHSSRGFWQFHHILENGAKSPYIDWFIIQDWPLRPYSSDRGHPANYAAWWNLPALPKLNTNHPDVQEFIIDIAKYWLEFGIDGWRLDVPQEIEDADFWRRFRKVVKSVNPQAYICGEIWEPAQSWLQGDQFDAVMNYIFTWIGLSFFGGDSLRKSYKREHLKLEKIDAGEFRKNVDEMHTLYAWEINQVQLNLLDSHDMARALWILNEDKNALKLCVLFQMTMPGAPCIYYGDEIGMSAGDDPLCRQAFPWHDLPAWDNELLDFYKRATRLRRQHDVLSTGSFEIVYAEGDVVAFKRELADQRAMVIFNRGAKPVSLPTDALLPGSGMEVWPETSRKILAGKELIMAAKSARIFIG